MPKTLLYGLTEQGINPDRFLKVYNIVRAVSGQISLSDLMVPGVTKNQVERIFEYLADHGVAEKSAKDLYGIRPNGIKTMNARIKSQELKPKEKKEGLLKRTRRRVSGE